MTLKPIPLHPRILVVPTGITKFIVSAMKQTTIIYSDLQIVPFCWGCTTTANNHTNFINNTIDVILNNIFETYEKITPQMLNQREDVVKPMTFNVEKTINNFSTTLKNWEISLPQLSIPTPTNSISTCLIKLSIKLNDTRYAFDNRITKIQLTKIGMHSNHIFALFFRNWSMLLKNCGRCRFLISKYCSTNGIGSCQCLSVKKQ